MLETTLTKRYLLTAVLLLCAAPFSMADNPKGVADRPESVTDNPKVVMQTSHGEMVIELFEKESPVTVANFLSYVDRKFYDGTIFHRVIPNFMVQGGGFSPDMQEKRTAEPIVNESKNRVHNERGTLAMARTNDPDSATAQFFINVRMNVALDYRMGEAGYTVFGKVIEGMATVDDIAVQETGMRGGMPDVPKEPVVIESIERSDTAE